jgi:thiamine-monophosphate kinase
MKTVSDIGELGLIERIAARLGSAAGGGHGPGDDAAVLPVTDERLVYTTDVLVEGVDFDFSYCSGADVGWKAIAANASDVAAMGASPRWSVAALSLRGDTPLELVDDLLDGMVEAGRRWRIELVGGDISTAPAMSVAVSMLGEAGAAGPVLRSGSRPGDRVCVTGSLGGAAAGLVALRGSLPREGAVERLCVRHLRPTARVEEAHALVEVGPTAMIDVSDGLAIDLAHLVESGGVGCSIDPAAIPVDPDLDALGSALDPLETAVLGGEDFELLFTIPPDGVRPARKRLAKLETAVTDIGAIIEGDRTIGDRSLEDWRRLGWEHLRVR